MILFSKFGEMQLMIPGEYSCIRSDRGEPGACEITIVGAPHGRPAHSGRQSLSLLRSQSRLEFDREKARGMRLNVPAGTGMRFEPGEEKQVHAGRFWWTASYLRSTRAK